MKEFLKDIFIDIFEEKHWSNYLLGILIWLMCLLIVGLLTCGITNGVNRIGRQEQSGTGTVTEKCFVPAHSESYGKGQSRWVDDAWHLHIKIDGLSDCIWVSHNYYNNTSIGDTKCIEYYTGRLWNSLYIISFCGREK